MKEDRKELAGRSPYKDMLNDRNVKRWFLNTQRSSPSYAYELLRRLGYIRKRLGVNLQQLAKMRPKQASNFILDMVTIRLGSVVENLLNEDFSDSVGDFVQKWCFNLRIQSQGNYVIR